MKTFLILLLIVFSIIAILLARALIIGYADLRRSEQEWFASRRNNHNREIINYD
jgi:type II secretory pathway pseudopilin PulG